LPKRRSRSALPTTVTELVAIATAASTGGKIPAAASVTSSRLQPKAQAEVLAEDPAGGPGEHDRVGDRADAAVDQGDVGTRTPRRAIGHHTPRGRLCPPRGTFGLERVGVPGLSKLVRVQVCELAFSHGWLYAAAGRSSRSYYPAAARPGGRRLSCVRARVIRLE
jgi:hypothetical protein